MKKTIARSWTTCLATTVAILVTHGCCLSDSIQFKKQKRTMLYMMAAAKALDDFKTKAGTYPMSGLGEFGDQFGVLNTWVLDSDDAWGQPLLYASSGDSYVLWSRGSDGQSEEPPSGGHMVTFESDIVMVDGRFWQGPEGTAAVNFNGESNPIARILKEQQHVVRSAPSTPN